MDPDRATITQFGLDPNPQWVPPNQFRGPSGAAEAIRSRMPPMQSQWPLGGMTRNVGTDDLAETPHHVAAIRGRTRPIVPQGQWGVWHTQIGSETDTANSTTPVFTLPEIMAALEGVESYTPSVHFPVSFESGKRDEHTFETWRRSFMPWADPKETFDALQQHKMQRVQLFTMADRTYDSHFANQAKSSADHINRVRMCPVLVDPTDPAGLAYDTLARFVDRLGMIGPALTNTGPLDSSTMAKRTCEFDLLVCGETQIANLWQGNGLQPNTKLWVIMHYVRSSRNLIPDAVREELMRDFGDNAQPMLAQVEQWLQAASQSLFDRYHAFQAILHQCNGDVATATQLFVRLTANLTMQQLRLTPYASAEFPDPRLDPRFLEDFRQNGQMPAAILQIGQVNGSDTDAALRRWPCGGQISQAYLCDPRTGYPTNVDPVTNRLVGTDTTRRLLGVNVRGTGGGESRVTQRMWTIVT